MGNFGTYNLAEGEIRLVWAQEKGWMLGEAAPLFRLHFRALQGGNPLSEVLHLNAVLPGYCYNSAFSESGVELHFAGETNGAGQAGAEPAMWLENRPNPFTGVTTLRFELTEAGDTELRISDTAGKLLFSQNKYYAAGRHEEILQLEGATGILFAELVTAQGNVVRKMLAVVR